MYGKLFDSTFTGSMFGKGSTIFAVWGYAIANAKRDGSVEINPNMLAAVLGDTVEGVTSALRFLQEPDPKSRSKNEEGRRLIQEGEYQYRIVNHPLYNGMRNEGERREYNRIKQREHRQRVSNGLSNTVSHGQPPSASVSVAVDVDVDKTKSKNQEMSSQGSTGPVETVFGHWRSVWSHPQAKLDDKRKRTISAALKLYTPEQLCAAISGYRQSQHHTGNNDRKTIYDDLCLLLRDAGHIDAGIAFATNKPETPMERFRRANNIDKPQGAVFDAVPHHPNLVKAG